MCLIEISILSTQDSPLPLPLSAGMSGSRCFPFPLIGLQCGCCSFPGRSWENYFLCGFNCLHLDFAFSTIRAQASCSPPPHHITSNGCQGNCLCFVTKAAVELEAPATAGPSWVLATKFRMASLCWFCLLSPRPLWTICKIRKLRKQRMKKIGEMLSKENPFTEMEPQWQIYQGD